MHRSEKIQNPRLLIAKLRNGDYAHPGEEEAIDLVIKGIKELIDCKEELKSPRRLKAIDVGCGLGGTANYIKTTLNFDIQGVDIDEKVIKYASEKYKDIFFKRTDVMNLSSNISEKFDLVYMFNSFYAFQDKQSVLNILSEITVNDGLLVIFDYSFKSANNGVEVLDLANCPIQPLILDDLNENLNQAGWELIRIHEISHKYEEWYTLFLDNLQNQKVRILDEFSLETFIKVEKTFKHLLEKIQQKILMGSVIYAKLK